MNNPLNNALHLFSSLLPAETAIIVRDDYIIESNAGCFRVAYSPKTHATALFYARHAHALESEPDASGTEPILHKERLALVKMFEVRHSVDARWDKTDNRQQLDLSWVRREISEVVHDLPRAHFREACLQRTAENNLSSVFINYEIKPDNSAPDGKARFKVAIATKAGENYRLSEQHADAHESHPGRIRTAFRAVGRQLVKWRLTTTFPLHVNDNGTERETFSRQEVPELIETDFSIRQERVWRGLDPVELRKDQRILPVLRAGSSVMRKITELKENSQNHPEELIRSVAMLAIHLALDGGLSVLSSGAIDLVGEIGEKEHVGHVPKAWRKIISNHSHRFVTMDSAMHKMLIRPDPGAFGDLEWLTPKKHLPSFAAGPKATRKVPPDETFNRWLETLLIAPYDSTFEYRGEGHKLQNPANLNDVKSVVMYASNGIILNFFPDTKEVFAHYHHPNHIIPNRNLPADAPHYLKAGEVLKFEPLFPERPPVSIPFSEFEALMQKRTGSPDLSLPSANMPDVSALTPGDVTFVGGSAL